jgi:hypothetical protein
MLRHLYQFTLEKQNNEMLLERVVCIHLLNHPPRIILIAVAALAEFIYNLAYPLAQLVLRYGYPGAFLQLGQSLLQLGLLA